MKVSFSGESRGIPEVLCSAFRGVRGWVAGCGATKFKIFASKFCKFSQKVRTNHTIAPLPAPSIRERAMQDCGMLIPPDT